MRINTNVAAINAYRNLSTSGGALGKSLEKLSSGYRINRAADDASGLVISEGLRAQVGGLKAATRNAQDGISVAQTAEGALTEVQSMLQRMRDLSVQSANGSNSQAARDASANEVQALTEEIERITQSTQFAGKSLLTGAGDLTFQVGANSGANNQVSISAVDTKISSLGIGSVANAAVTGVAEVATVALTAGSAFTVTVAGKSYSGTASSSVTATDLGNALDGDGNKLSDNSKVTVGGTTTGGTITFNATGAQTDVTATGATASTTTQGVTAVSVGDVTSTVAAKVKGGDVTAVSTIDSALELVSTARGELGAVQNRFERTISNLGVAVENLSASESRIRDTDMAMEMTNYSKNQILQQAGTAMLAQANASSQSVLSLLRG